MKIAKGFAINAATYLVMAWAVWTLPRRDMPHEDKRVRFTGAVRRTLADTYRGHSVYFEEIIEKGKRAGEFLKNTNTRAVAAALVGLLEGLMIREYADQELTDLESDYPEVVRLIVDGITQKRE